MPSQAPEDGSAVRVSPSRRGSFDSDGPASSIRPSIMTSFPTLKPAPAYVALVAASQLATDNQRMRLQEELYDLNQTATIDDEDALFSDTALATINNFLDHLLYSFLLHARSTSLASLRGAMEQVLKGKLARAALATANEELDELQASGEEENYSAAQDEHDEDFKSNIDRIFRRTRLRIMVYTRLGEMEDEEEESLLQDDSVWSSGHAGNAENISAMITPAATIFLTSILEFIAEQCVEIAAQAAYSRAAMRKSGRITPMFGTRDTPSHLRIVIEEYDVERIALNSTLGRLWRTWRKSARALRQQGLGSPTAISPSGRQLSARTSSSTLRPSQQLDSPIAAADPDSRITLLQSAVTRSALQPLEQNQDQATQNRPPLVDEHNLKSENAHEAQTTITHRYGYPTPAPSSQGSHAPQLSDDARWHGKRISNGDADLSNPAAIEDGVDARLRRSTDTNIAVPVSGMLTLHLPANGVVEASIGAGRVSEDNVSRFDFGSQEAASRERGRQSNIVHEQRQLQATPYTSPTTPSRHAPLLDQQTDEVTVSEASRNSVRSWTNDISNLYQPNSANTSQPLRVRVPGGGEYMPTISVAGGVVRSLENGAACTPSSLRANGQPPKVVRVVTAQQITPTSDMSYTPRTDRHLSKASFEPMSPFTPSVTSTSPAMSPLRPKPINPPPEAGGLSPREPRIQTESTRDFADFLRSTAPTEEQSKVAPIVTPMMSANTSRPNSPEAILARSSASPTAIGSSHHSRPIPISRAKMQASQRTSEDWLGGLDRSRTPVITKVRNPALEPRDPVIRGRSNDDLISFLREGPPGAGSPKPTARENLERRTADKMVMSSAVMPGRISDVTMNSGSRQESLNSHSPLLQQSVVTTPRTEQHVYSSPSSGATILQQASKPQHHVKDPYAIPTEDEDDDVLTALPRRAHQQDSLIDFLNNTGPVPTGRDPMSGKSSLDESKKSFGLGLRDSSGKGLSLHPTTPSSPATPGFARSADSPTTSGSLTKWRPNEVAPNSMPQLGEFLSGPGSSRTSGENTKPSMAIRRTDWASQRSPMSTPNRSKSDLLPQRTESRNQGVRGLLRKIAV